MGQTGQDDTRTELSRPGEPGLTTRMVEKGIQQQRPLQQDNNSITFKNNTHINPKDIASAFNKQFINTILHKTNTTNNKITRKVLRLQQTQIHSTTEQVQAAIKSSKNNNSNRTRQHQHKALQTYWQERTKVPHEHIQRCTQRQQDTSCMETGQHHTYPKT